MIDRVDLLIAVIGVVVSVLGSSTAMWMALSKKPDRADLVRVENRLEEKLTRVETRLEEKLAQMETRLEEKLARVETRLEEKIDALSAGLEGKAGREDLARIEVKLDAVILRLVPQAPPS